MKNYQQENANNSNSQQRWLRPNRLQFNLSLYQLQGIA
jgi:hypothetical protein